MHTCTAKKYKVMKYTSQLKIDLFYSLTFVLKTSFNEKKNVINHQIVWVFDFGDNFYHYFYE